MKTLLFLLILLTSSICYADYKSLSTMNSEDRLEQLSKSLHSSDASDDDDEFVEVFPEDYAKLNLEPAYKDSAVIYATNEKSYYEVRHFPNNIKMIRRLDKDGATFFNYTSDEKFIENSWRVVCYRDHITDIKHCIINKYQVMLMKNSKHGLMFSVTKDVKSLHPLRTNYFKVDKNKALETRSVFTGGTVNKIIEQMKRGELLYTRFSEWDGSQYEETLSLYGFSSAYEYMNMMYRRIK